MDVADMVERQPWLDERDFPVEAIGAARRRRTPSGERGDRRRLRARTASPAPSALAREGVQGHRARGGGGDRRRHEDQRADGARGCCTTTARRCIRWPSARRSCARSTWSGTGWSGAGPRSISPTRSTTARAGVMCARSTRPSAGSGRRTARAWRRLFGAAARELRERSRRPPAAGPPLPAPSAAAGSLRPARRAARHACSRAASRHRRPARCSAAWRHTRSARSPAR